MNIVLKVENIGGGGGIVVFLSIPVVYCAKFSNFLSEILSRVLKAK